MFTTKKAIALYLCSKYKFAYSKISVSFRRFDSKVDKRFNIYSDQRSQIVPAIYAIWAESFQHSSMFINTLYNSNDYNFRLIQLTSA